MKKRSIKIYDGAKYCTVGPCPIIEYSPDKKIVKISDPQKPENGQFTLGVIEYNSLIKNAKTIDK